ncbi:VOC family protein [Shewanella litorisediminis]|uniref:VOC family protein n=1 Tax=Shewanella litorisediminis TaxID=1173586 RepID=A0ABX7G8C1_9GAMM|nr:VOC family protein [Shewanella litorisediminis]MCL2919346.1 VOC family protein [Shewanella litorisediminis]QRH03488.1 VOC family protein [Shewanella litorisediminis]
MAFGFTHLPACIDAVAYKGAADYMNCMEKFMLKRFEEEAVEFYQNTIFELEKLGISIEPMTLSHLAFRTQSTLDYLRMREYLESHAIANVENYWNGRPISKILLKEPLRLSYKTKVQLIELIPPPHQRVYPLGFEHLGIVLGEELESFANKHQSVMTGRQFQSDVCRPYYIRFDSYHHVKFYQYSLQHVCELEGKSFEHFERVEASVYRWHSSPYPNTHGYSSLERYLD